MKLLEQGVLDSTTDNDIASMGDKPGSEVEPVVAQDAYRNVERVGADLSTNRFSLKYFLNNFHISAYDFLSAFLL